MGRNKEENARFAGAAWALEMCEKDGIEACRKELEYRGILHIPLAVTRSQIDDANKTLRRNIMATVLLVICAALRDEYGFGKERMARLIDRFNLKAACIAEKYVVWKDIKQSLEEETGIKLDLPDEFLEENYD